MSLHQVTDASFENDVLKSSIPVLMDFWAEWCGPCRMLLPILEDVAPEFEGRIKIVKVNVDSCPKTASRFNVRSIPTLILMKDGEQHSTKVGLLTKPKLIEWINSAL